MRKIAKKSVPGMPIPQEHKRSDLDWYCEHGFDCAQTSWALNQSPH